MNATPTTSTAPKKTVSPRHALLEDLIGIVTQHANDQFLDLAQKLSNELLDATDGDITDMQARVRAGNHLRNAKHAFLHLASTTLEKAIRKEIALLSPVVNKAKVLKAEEPLSLVPYEEMDSKVKLGSVSKPFEVLYADQLQTLNVRLAFLLDRDILRVNQNPFRPEVFLMALQQAWTEFETDAASAELLQPLIKPGMFIELAPMLDALNQALQRQGVLPGSVDGYKGRKADAPRKPASKLRGEQAALAQQLRQLFATPEVAGQVADDLASTLVGNVDLSIPDLPMSALQAGSTWVPNAAAVAGAAAPAAGAGMGAPAGSGGAALPGHAAGGFVAANGMPGTPAGMAMAGAQVAAGMQAMVNGQVVMPAGAWAPGPALAAGGGVWVQPPAPGSEGVQATPQQISQQMAQMAQMNARQPLFNYLAQLQKSVPYAGMGAGFAGASGGQGGPGGEFGDAGVSSGFGGAAGPGGFAGAVAAGPGGAGGVAGAAGPGGVTIPADVAAGLLGAFAGAGAGHAGMAGGAAAGAGGDGVTSAKVFYLPTIKENIPQGSLSRADESTIDLLSAIFDTVFRDQNISPEIRDLIRFLQIPVLKAALMDKDFFFQDSHPARRLIDLLSRLGWEQRKSPEDPLFQAMQRSVDRVGRDYDQELSVFTEAVNELEASIQAEESAAATAIAAPIAAALKQEKMAEATKSARQAVALRIGTGEVIAVVEAFLEQRWVSVLTIAYSVEDEKPGAVNNATRTMDDLIWSVKPKITAEERKQLIAKLPGLLSTLNKWLDIIKWQDSDRLQFFAELAECHASIVRAPLDMSPERQVEIAMQVAQQAAERRLELQAKAPPPPPEAAPEDDDAVIEVDGLARGMWLEFDQEDGSTRKVKLAWISPLRTLYIFSTSARQEAFSMSGEALAQKFRDNLVQVHRPDAVVAVALSQALARTAVNDESIDLPQSAVG
jgi:hypothetical protein